MPERNAELAAAIARDGRPAYIVAADAVINPTALSGIIAGRVNPTAAVRGRLAAVLGVPEDELFEPVPA